VLVCYEPERVGSKRGWDLWERKGGEKERMGSLAREDGICRKGWGERQREDMRREERRC
jgi:hypothetical protein